MDSGTPTNSFTVLDYAYADPGETIRTHQVSRGQTLGLLAIGRRGGGGLADSTCQAAVSTLREHLEPIQCVFGESRSGASISFSP